MMSRHRIGSVLVGNRSDPPMIVTETDVVRRVLAEDRNPPAVLVEEIMSGPLIMVDEHRPIEHAGELMAEHEIRHVAVSSGPTVVGLLSVRDLMPAVHLLPIPVERMMTRMPVIVPAEETTRNAAFLMAHAKVSALLVAGRRLQARGLNLGGFSRQDIAGIVTGTDLVRDVVDKDLDPSVTPVCEIMSGPLFSLSGTEEVMTAFDVMARGSVRHLAVTSGEEITGLLSVEDVIEPAWLHVAAGALRKDRA